MSDSTSSISRASSLLVSASAGCFAFGLLYLCGDKSKALNHLLNFYPPSGALSGVLVLGTLTWLLCWAVLAARWSRKPPATTFAVNLSIALLLVALLFTFPPFVRSI